MNRSHRKQIAEETLRILEVGTYSTAAGVIDLSRAIQATVDGTRLLSPAELAALRTQVLSQPAPGIATQIEVRNETSLAGIEYLLQLNRGEVAALNFASAKNPGGGFLTGSQAQEESLARSSALYASQQKAFAFYEKHRRQTSCLYSDAMIVTPGCPIFRDDAGALLSQPHSAMFITAAAPNAGAVRKNSPEEIPLIEATLSQRAELVLAVAAEAKITNLVLGAWGCGVFKNDPQMVAGVFAKHLHGAWLGRFQHVVFSVLDTSAERETVRAFQSRFTG